MKALSIQQPWVWAILNLGKDIENRSWATKYRGPLLLHAGKKFDMQGYQWIKENITEDIPEPSELIANQSGKVMGICFVTDCVTESKSPWFFGKNGFVLKRPKAFDEPFEYRGKLGFFNIEVEEMI